MLPGIFTTQLALSYANIVAKLLTEVAGKNSAGVKIIDIFPKKCITFIKIKKY